MKKMKKRTKKILIFSIIGVVIAVVTGVNVSNSSDELTNVQADLVIIDDLSEKVTATGRIQPKTKVDVTSEVSAQIIDLYINEGDMVEKGQLLAQLDTLQLNSDVAQAKYSLEEITARVKAAKSTFEKNELEFARQKALFEKDLTSETAFTDAKFAYDNSEASFDAMVAQMKTGQARLDKMVDNLNKTRITAPMSGIVTYLQCEVGEIAQAQTAYSQGRKLMTVSDLSEFEVEVDVDESEISKIKLQLNAEIKVDAFRDIVFAGTVEEIGNSALVQGQGTENYASTFKVKVKILDVNSDIRPGMSATVHITTSQQNDAVIVPYAAVITKKFHPDSLLNNFAKNHEAESSNVVYAAENNEAIQDDSSLNTTKNYKKKKKIKRTGVFVVRGGEAQFVEVKTGIADEQNIAILEGLNPGDTVISGSYKTLRQLSIGDKIEIDEQSIERINESAL